MLCASVFGVELWHTLLVKNKDKFVRCYILWAKRFSSNRYFASVTGLLIDTNVVNSSALLFNERHRFVLQCSSSFIFILYFIFLFADILLG